MVIPFAHLYSRAIHWTLCFNPTDQQHQVALMSCHQEWITLISLPLLRNAETSTSVHSLVLHANQPTNIHRPSSVHAQSGYYREP